MRSEIGSFGPKAEVNSEGIMSQVDSRLSRIYSQLNSMDNFTDMFVGEEPHDLDAPKNLSISSFVNVVVDGLESIEERLTRLIRRWEVMGLKR